MPAGGPLGSPVGRHRDRVTIQSPVRESKPGGQHRVTGWADGPTVWATVRPATAAEGDGGAARPFSTATLAVTIRGGVDVRPEYRLVWVTNDNRVLNVLGAVPGPSGVANQLVIYCRELLTPG